MGTINDRRYQHLVPNTLIDRDIILSVSEDIDNSFSGRLDIMGLHIFFMESASMIRNAVNQYQQGFLDAAFYSVRSAREIARVVTYLSDQNQPLKSEVYKKWVQGGTFPHDSQIRKMLAKTSPVYREVRKALSIFFDEQDERLKQVNKYIHKQGYKTFYLQNSMNPDLIKSRKQVADKLFSDFITNSVIEIAFLRLCIDPFPVLLQDESIMYKIHFQPITFPYSDQTIEFMGKENIERYRNTLFYKSYVENYEQNETLCEAAYSIINDEYYSRSSWNELKSQLQLLHINEQMAVLIFNTSRTISDIYFDGGLSHYISDIKSINGFIGLDSRDFEKVKLSEIKTNQRYHKSLMSYFSYKDNECWVEHNRQLTTKQIEQINKIIKDVYIKNILPFFS